MVLVGSAFWHGSGEGFTFGLTWALNWTTLVVVTTGVAESECFEFGLWITKLDWANLSSVLAIDLSAGEALAWLANIAVLIPGITDVVNGGTVDTLDWWTLANVVLTAAIVDSEDLVTAWFTLGIIDS